MQIIKSKNKTLSIDWGSKSVDNWQLMVNNDCYVKDHYIMTINNSENSYVWYCDTSDVLVIHPDHIKWFETVDSFLTVYPDCKNVFNYRVEKIINTI